MFRIGCIGLKFGRIKGKSINRMSAVEAAQRRLEVSKRRLCTSLKGFVSLGMPPDNALRMCKANADEQWCKAYLGLE